MVLTFLVMLLRSVFVAGIEFACLHFVLFHNFGRESFCVFSVSDHCCSFGGVCYTFLQLFRHFFDILGIVYDYRSGVDVVLESGPIDSFCRFFVCQFQLLLLTVKAGGQISGRRLL